MAEPTKIKIEEGEEEEERTKKRPRTQSTILRIEKTKNLETVLEKANQELSKNQVVLFNLSNQYESLLEKIKETEEINNKLTEENNELKNKIDKDVSDIEVIYKKKLDDALEQQKNELIIYTENKEQQDLKEEITRKIQENSKQQEELNKLKEDIKKTKKIKKEEQIKYEKEVRKEKEKLDAVKRNLQTIQFKQQQEQELHKIELESKNKVIEDKEKTILLLDSSNQERQNLLIQNSESAKKIYDNLIKDFETKGSIIVSQRNEYSEQLRQLWYELIQSNEKERKTNADLQEITRKNQEQITEFVRIQQENLVQRQEEEKRINYLIEKGETVTTYYNNSQKDIEILTNEKNQLVNFYNNSKTFTIDEDDNIIPTSVKININDYDKYKKNITIYSPDNSLYDKIIKTSEKNRKLKEDNDELKRNIEEYTKNLNELKEVATSEIESRAIDYNVLKIEYDKIKDTPAIIDDLKEKEQEYINDINKKSKDIKDKENDINILQIENNKANNIFSKIELVDENNQLVSFDIDNYPNYDDHILIAKKLYEDYLEKNKKLKEDIAKNEKLINEVEELAQIKANNESTITQLTENLLLIEEEKDKYSNQLKDLNLSIEDNNDKLSTLTTKLQDYEQRIVIYETKNNDIDRLNDLINEIKQKNIDLENNLERLNKEIIENKSKLEQKENEVKQYQDIISNTKKEIVIFTNPECPILPDLEKIKELEQQYILQIEDIKRKNLTLDNENYALQNKNNSLSFILNDYNRIFKNYNGIYNLNNKGKLEPVDIELFNNESSNELIIYNDNIIFKQPTNITTTTIQPILNEFKLNATETVYIDILNNNQIISERWNNNQIINNRTYLLLMTKNFLNAVNYLINSKKIVTSGRKVQYLSYGNISYDEDTILKLVLEFRTIDNRKLLELEIKNVKVSNNEVSLDLKKIPHHNKFYLFTSELIKDVVYSNGYIIIKKMRNEEDYDILFEYRYNLKNYQLDDEYGTKSILKDKNIIIEFSNIGADMYRIISIKLMLR